MHDHAVTSYSHLTKSINWALARIGWPDSSAIAKTIEIFAWAVVRCYLKPCWPRRTDIVATTGHLTGRALKTNQTNTIDSQAYRIHSVLMTLDRYAGFYQLLSDSVMQFLSSGTGAAINIQSYLCQSIGGTLNSVRVVVSEGRINDGYALVRKYFDLVMLSVYLDLYLNDRHDEGAIAVEQVKNWLRGKKALPDYKSMKTYVAGSRSTATGNRHAAED